MIDNDSYHECRSILKILSLNFLLPIWKLIGLGIFPPKSKQLLQTIIQEYYLALKNSNEDGTIATIEAMTESIAKCLGEKDAKYLRNWLEEKAIPDDNKNHLWISEFERTGIIYPELEEGMFLENPLAWKRERFCCLLGIIYKHFTSPLNRLEKELERIEKDFDNFTPAPDEWSHQILEEEHAIYGDMSILMTTVYYYGAYHHFIVFWQQVESTFTDDEIKDILEWMINEIAHEYKTTHLVTVKITPPKILLRNFLRTCVLYAQNHK